jgi:hypothetical protein
MATMTFEEIDRHLDQFDLDAIQTETSAESLADPSAKLEKICTVFRIIKPILNAILVFPLPKKWKDGINTFISLMETICV